MKTTSKIACLIAMLAAPMFAQREPLTGYLATYGGWVLCVDGVSPVACPAVPVTMYMIGVAGAEDGERVAWNVSYVNQRGAAGAASGVFTADNVAGYTSVWFFTTGAIRSWSLSLSRYVAPRPARSR